MNKLPQIKSSKGLGFTLVELLVVIAIVAILAAVVFLMINPLELTRRGRDASRLSDLANLTQAINVAVQESTNSAQPVLCDGSPYPCSGSTHSGTRNSDGTGWVNVNLSVQKSVSVPTLPIDPTNTAQLHYTYCADNSGGAEGWEIDARLESQQQSGKMATDGGNDNTLFETGSNLTLVAPAGGSCAF